MDLVQSLENGSTKKYKQAFFLALLTAAVMFLPYVIMGGGYFTFYGDFNVQQIPFISWPMRPSAPGISFWNWYTDLGANFIGSYSFYLLMSPFFWLTRSSPPALSLPDGAFAGAEIRLRLSDRVRFYLPVCPQPELRPGGRIALCVFRLWHL